MVALDGPCGVEYPFHEGLRCTLHIGHGGQHRHADVPWAAASVHVFKAHQG